MAISANSFWSMESWLDIDDRPVLVVTQVKDEEPNAFTTKIKLVDGPACERCYYPSAGLVGPKVDTWYEQTSHDRQEAVEHHLHVVDSLLLGAMKIDFGEEWFWRWAEKNQPQTPE